MNPIRSISWFLVRYGRLQRVGWFGTVGSFSLVRNDQVVVETFEGEWIGCVLQVSELGPRQAEQTGFRPTGEVLRKIAVEDFQREEIASRIGLGLRQSIEKYSLDGIVVLDIDVSLDGRVGCVQFLGTSSAVLGRLAVDLSREFHLERVQWISGELHAFVDASQGQSIQQNLSDTPVNFRSNGSESSEQCHDYPWIRLIHRPDSSELGSVARQFRHELGLLGLYLQKVSPSTLSTSDSISVVTGASEVGSGAIARQWMVRLRVAGGRMLATQLSGLLDVADELTKSSLRLTMRQGLQLHGVLPREIGSLLHRLEDLALSTRGTCSDTVRNVTCCAHTPKTASAVLAQRLARQLTTRWLPDAPWYEFVIEPPVDIENYPSSLEPPHRKDTTYPDGYLPHKWKIGVATSNDNCVNVLVNDLGLIVRSLASSTRESVVDCYVGGGLAYRPDNRRSFPQLAVALGCVAPEAVESLTEILLAIYRKFIEQEAGANNRKTNRGSRYPRRWKYVVARLGIEQLRTEVRGRMKAVGFELGECEPKALVPWSAHSSWEPDGKGNWDWTIPIASGRIVAPDHRKHGEGFEHAMDEGIFSRREIREWLSHGKGVTIGPRHSLVVHEISDRDRKELQANRLTPVASDSSRLRIITCVAKPTCPFALAESERDYGKWVEAIATNRVLIGNLVRSQADGGERTVAISGCPNGCAHSLSADLGFVAEAPQQFRIFLGGDGVRLGTALGVIAGPEELGSGLEKFDSGLEET